MPRTRIKICGIRRVEDAVAAARLGADAIGMVFHPAAPRCISIEQARQILDALPALVTAVGLFVDAPVGEVKRIAGSLGLRHLQLHGHETPAYVDELPGYVILKAIRTARETFMDELNLWRKTRRPVGGLVLESPGAAGGSGVANDWAYLAACQKEGRFAGLPPLIAAGGLNPQDVEGVIDQLHPWAVDVSSGVELERGVKSERKLREFMAAVARADQRGEGPVVAAGGS